MGPLRMGRVANVPGSMAWQSWGGKVRGLGSGPAHAPCLMWRAGARSLAPHWEDTAMQALVLERKGELSLRGVDLPLRVGPTGVKAALHMVGVCGSAVVKPQIRVADTVDQTGRRPLQEGAA